MIILANFSVPLKQSNQTSTDACRFSVKDCIGIGLSTLFNPFSLTAGALFESLLSSGLFK